MEITLTPPVEEFIQRKLAEGYESPSKVIEDLCLKVMEEDEDWEADPDNLPPGTLEKLEEARNGIHHPWSTFDEMLARVKRNVGL